MSVEDLRGIYKGSEYPYITAWKENSSGVHRRNLYIHEKRWSGYSTRDTPTKLLVPPEFVYMEDGRDEM